MGKIKEKKIKIKNEKTVLIRTSKESDAESYLELGKSVMSENIFSLTKSQELTMTVKEEGEWIKSNIDNPNHLIIVAEIEGQIVGQLDFANGHRERIAHTGEFGMSVHKDFRGCGIGGLLLESLIMWCRSNTKIEKINLCVHHTNNRAIKMYEKYGFKKEGIRSKDLKYSKDEYVDTILMGLFL